MVQTADFIHYVHIVMLHTFEYIHNLHTEYIHYKCDLGLYPGTHSVYCSNRFFVVLSHCTATPSIHIPYSDLFQSLNVNKIHQIMVFLLYIWLIISHANILASMSTTILKMTGMYKDGWVEIVESF